MTLLSSVQGASRRTGRRVQLLHRRNESSAAVETIAVVPRVRHVRPERAASERDQNGPDYCSGDMRARTRSPTSSAAG